MSWGRGKIRSALKNNRDSSRPPQRQLAQPSRPLMITGAGEDDDDDKEKVVGNENGAASGGEIVGYLVKWDDKGCSVTIARMSIRSHLDARLRKQRGPGYYHFHSLMVSLATQEWRLATIPRLRMCSIYHALVLLAVKDVKVEDAFQVLRQRFSKSGIEEKSSRKST
ncbi:hypothetical protein Scep_025235 [Stephania cephalantha]|uniref:Uncharacterized protein n=1 Tax=Stephania cephalantha TaxID=152367 RepID=A0AAP0HRD2_9MAGN